MASACGAAGALAAILGALAQRASWGEALLAYLAGALAAGTLGCLAGGLLGRPDGVLGADDVYPAEPRVLPEVRTPH